MKQLYLVLLLFSLSAITAQDDSRTLLRGQVLYRNVNVPNENVINITTEMATITNKDGRFAIHVKEGDELAFTAVNYELEVLTITAQMLKDNRLVVEVNEKVTELDEVVISPENKEKFLEAEAEKFKKVEYEIDRSTEVDNISLSQAERGMKDGVNFVSIFKALLGSGSKKQKENVPKLRPSQVLRHVYNDEFFVVDLKLPQDKIEDFLFYVDATMDERTLLKKDNEFQLLDFLVNTSKEYRTQMNEEK